MSDLPLDGVKPSTLLSTFKQLVFDALPWSKSSHLSEAIACGCGYNTHAAYMADLKGGSALPLVPVSRIAVDAMSDRLAKLASRDGVVLRQELGEALQRISSSFPNDIVPIGPGSSIERDGITPPVTRATATLIDALHQAVEDKVETLYLMEVPNTDPREFTLAWDFGSAPKVTALHDLAAHVLPAARTLADIPEGTGSGEFTFLHQGRKITVEVLIGMTNVRLRIFDIAGGILDRLGISGLQAWRDTLHKGRGLMVVAGGDGSGKTTTLNASLNALREAAGVPDHGQPLPSVTLLGELRIREDAFAVLKELSKDRLVLASVTATSAREALASLDHLGLASCTRAILHQALLPSVCSSCNGRGGTCRTCGGKGSAGKTLVSECASFDTGADAIDAADRIRQGETRMPWKPILDDASDKVAMGLVWSGHVERQFGKDDVLARVRERTKMHSSPASEVAPRLSGMGISKLGDFLGTLALPSGLILVCGPWSRDNDRVARSATQEVNRRTHRYQPAASYRDELTSWHDLQTAVSESRLDLVFATLTADCIAMAINKIRAMASGTFLDGKLTDRLKGILVQRSIPKTCTACAHRQNDREPCLECDGTRVAGSTTISTFRQFDSPQDVEDTFRNRRDEDDDTGMIDDALDKMVAGIVTGQAIRDIYGIRADERALDRAIQMPDDR